MGRVLIVEVPVTLCVPFIFRSVIYTWVVYLLLKYLLLCACAGCKFLVFCKGGFGLLKWLDILCFAAVFEAGVVSLPCWRGCEFSFLWFWILKLIFLGCSWGFGIFQACSIRCFLIIGDVERAAIFEVLFSCWWESVIERGSLIEILEKG